MKKVTLALLSGYQNIISPFLHQLLGMRTVCRYSPSCSEYAKQVITKHGIGKGLVLATKRILSCQPFFAVKHKAHPSL